MGELTLSVAGVSLTANALERHRQDHVGWYVAPVLHWLADNWVTLLHEERFDWPTRDAAPAALACRRALRWFSGAETPKSRDAYRAVQAWYLRHGLRSAAAGGLFPDLFVRRFADDIELSWTGEAPPFASKGLVFESGAGVARLAVEDVAGPLWDLLRWVAANPPPDIDPSFRDDWTGLCDKVERIAQLRPGAFEAAVVAEELLRRVKESFANAGHSELANDPVSPDRPFIERLSPAIAMFGGLRPDLADADIDVLRDLIVSMEGGRDGDQLDALVQDRQLRPAGRVPHEDGYVFAEELLEDLDEGLEGISADGAVDIGAICRRLDIDVQERRLETNTIRGVALAGEGFGSKILVNLSSPFNRDAEGRRFTIAHELCHVLFDRSRARRVVHSSGPWVAPAIEKRANAFAAYLLMPPGLVRRALDGRGPSDEEAIGEASRRLGVNPSALIEHLYNLGMIDETEREQLRGTFAPRPRLVQ